MPQITNLVEAERVLNAYVPRPLDINKVYNLDTVRALAAAVGNPQDSLRIIHVAGTSGKTSTSYYAASILRSAGHRVGLTVSPHISHVNERVQVDLEPLAEPRFCVYLTEFIDLVDATDIKPTYFELLMVFAYWVFAREQVDYAVIEVGMGGTWDASNCVSRADKVCIITDIGIDHTRMLGTVVSEIAYWKAGIIQPFNQVFMHMQDDAIVGVVRARTNEQQGTLNVLPPVQSPIYVQQMPLFQQRNFALAAAAVNYALRRDGHEQLDETVLKQAAAISVPGRMELRVKDGAVVLLDGAHNPQKLQALALSIRAAYPGKRIAVVCAVTASREHAFGDITAQLVGLSDAIWCTTFSSSQDLLHQAANPDDVCRAISAAGGTAVAIVDPLEALRQAIASRPDVVLVTGSIYLVGVIRRAI